VLCRRWTNKLRLARPHLVITKYERHKNHYYRGGRFGPKAGRRPNALRALAIPAMATPADAPVRVEQVRTGAVPIPMISGFAPPVATGGFRLSGKQGSDRQDRNGGNKHSKLIHVPSPYIRTLRRFGQKRKSWQAYEISANYACREEQAPVLASRGLALIVMLRPAH
jgi:hypothetical protein